MSFSFDFSSDDDDKINEPQFKMPKLMSDYQKKSAKLSGKVKLQPFHELSYKEVADKWTVQENSQEDKIYFIDHFDLTGSIPSIRYVQKQCLQDFDHKVKKYDVIKGVNEGGAKIWECSIDLMKYMQETNLFKDKLVMELGCGIGMPGLLAHKMGAKSVHFQDYNTEVLVDHTVPSTILLMPETTDLDSLTGARFNEVSQANSLDKVFKFYSGDWSFFVDSLKTKYDVILTSETIYEEENYKSLHDILKHILADNGFVLLAAKSYYFGVGGNVQSWIDYVEEQKYFKITEVKSIGDNLPRKILKMTLA